MSKIIFSIIIPLKEINNYFTKETLPAILGQTFQDFEIILIPDKKTKVVYPKTTIIPSWPKTGPADKRDLGVQQAKGEILAFLDDDSYPDKYWLKNALKVFQKNPHVTAVCGPSLTPINDNLRQKASGYVWSSWLGSGGAGRYRCAETSKREVDDFPTVNLLVRKEDFLKVGGFDSYYWPGEDTKLCHDLVYKLNKKILYSPKVKVYHHRREIFIPHLKQISRYGLHRGHFARILPKTSFRLGYLFPSLFVLGLILGLPFIYILYWGNFHNLGNLIGLIYLGVVGIYLLALLINSLNIFTKEKNISLSLLVISAIVTTHLIYGLYFLVGLFSPKLHEHYQR